MKRKHALTDRQQKKRLPTHFQELIPEAFFVSAQFDYDINYYYLSEESRTLHQVHCKPKSVTDEHGFVI